MATLPQTAYASQTAFVMTQNFVPSGQICRTCSLAGLRQCTLADDTNDKHWIRLRHLQAFKVSSQASLSTTMINMLINGYYLQQAGIGKKLVTAFAAIKTNLYWMINCVSNIVLLQCRASAQKSNGLTHWNANAVPWQLAHRDNFQAKVPGQVAGWAALPTLSPYTSRPL